jgi:hypothetical protein
VLPTTCVVEKMELKMPWNMPGASGGAVTPGGCRRPGLAIRWAAERARRDCQRVATAPPSPRHTDARRLLQPEPAGVPQRELGQHRLLRHEERRAGQANLGRGGAAVTLLWPRAAAHRGYPRARMKQRLCGEAQQRRLTIILN